MRFIWLMGIAMASLLSGCTTVSYDVQNMQKNFAEAMQSSENIVQKAQTDYREKSLLVDNLRKGGSGEFKTSEADISRRLKNMESLMQKISDSRKQMIKANADIASLSYNRSKVTSREAEYERLDKAAQDFQEAAKELNRSAVAYSLESNSLADLVSQKKLFLTFEAADFDKRLQDNTRISQDNLKGMQKELERTVALVNNIQGDHKEEAASIEKEMESTAQKYSSSAQRFAGMGKDVRDVTAGAPRISSMDPNWPQVQKLVDEFDKTVQELSQLNDDFQKKLESFRALLRAHR